MTLGELIAALEAEDPALVLPEGFVSPHSYRGFCDELAFEPAPNVTVGQVLDAARGAVGATYHGWKGGEFTMHGNTECWLAVEGGTGESIGPVLLRLMIAAAKAAQPVEPPAVAQPEPATVIVVTEEGGKERRYAADGFELGLFGMSVTSGGKQVARYVSGTYRFAREEGATLPDTAERQALQDIIRLVDALDEPGPAADMIRLEAMRGLGQQVDAEDECDSAGQNEASESDELRELLAEVLNDASPSPAHAGWIERAQALGVKGWDGDPIGASLSDTIEEQDL